MQIDSANKAAPAQEQVKTELLDKDGSFVKDAEPATKTVNEIPEEVLEQLHSKPAPETKSKAEESSNSKADVKKPGLMKKALMVVGGALVLLFGFKFLFGKKK